MQSAYKSLLPFSTAYNQSYVVYAGNHFCKVKLVDLPIVYAQIQQKKDADTAIKTENNQKKDDQNPEATAEVDFANNETCDVQEQCLNEAAVVLGVEAEEEVFYNATLLAEQSTKFQELYDASMQTNVQIPL